MIKRLINSLLYPNKIIGCILFILGFGLLIYVFSFHLEDTIIAYVSYALSTYALIIFILCFCKICRFGNGLIKKNRLYKLYQENFFTVTRLNLYLTIIFNILYCIFNLSVGIYYRSFWFITFAVYYFLLGLMKILLLYNIKDFGESKLKEYKRLKWCGIMLLLLDIVLTGMIVLILKNNQNIIYAGYIIYIVALYDFYLIISAFINAFKYRKSDSPVLLASKFINLTVAMISMLSLEVAMIYQFGNNDLDFRRLMIGIFGGAICAINTFMAIYMIFRANRNLKEYNNLYKSK